MGRATATDAPVARLRARDLLMLPEKKVRPMTATDAPATPNSPMDPPGLAGASCRTAGCSAGGHFANVLYALALGLWFGGILFTGAFAAIIFPTLRDLGVELTRFGSFDAAEHWKIAAGSVMERAFFMLDLIQVTCVLTLGLLFCVQVWLLGHRLRAKANLLRGLLLAALLVTTGYHVLVLAPRMNANLRQFWTLAESATVDEAGNDARFYQSAFDADHPRASTLLSTNALLVGGLVITSALALGRPRGNRGQR